MTTTALDDLFTATEGYHVTRTLLALWRLGVLKDASTTGKINAGQYAAERGWEPALLQAALEYLVIRGYFENADGCFELSERGHSLAPYFGYLPMHVGAYQPVLIALEDLIRGCERYGAGVRRDEVEMLGGMTALEEHVLGRLTDLTGGATFGKVLDLGCGSGRVLSRILQLNPGVTAVGVDWEQAAVDDAARALARAGLADRATVLRGDAASVGDLPAGATCGVDLVIAMFVMHEIYRQKSGPGVIGCLRDIAALLGTAGRLLMVEVSRIDPGGPRPGLRFIPEYQLIHEFSNQRLASQQVWRDMLAEAGLTVLRTEPAGMCEAFCFVAASRAGGDQS